MHFTKPDCCCGLERSQEVNLWSARYTRTNTFPVKKSNGEWKTNTIFIFSSFRAYMCCLLCLQWAFILNNFAGIDLVKLIPHTVYLVKCVCVCVCVCVCSCPCWELDLRSLSMGLKHCVEMMWSVVTLLSNIHRERDIHITYVVFWREREQGIKLFICRPIRHIEPSA